MTKQEEVPKRLLEKISDSRVPVYYKGTITSDGVTVTMFIADEDWIQDEEPLFVEMKDSNVK